MVNVDKQIQMAGVFQDVVAEQSAAIDVEGPEQTLFLLLDVGDELHFQRPLHVVGVNRLAGLAGVVIDDACEQRGVCRHGGLDGSCQPVGVERAVERIKIRYVIANFALMPHAFNVNAILGGGEWCGRFHERIKLRVAIVLW